MLFRSCLLSVVDPNDTTIRQHTVYSSSIDGLAGKARTISSTYLLPKSVSYNTVKPRANESKNSIAQEKVKTPSIEIEKDRYSKKSKSNIKNPAAGGLKIRDVAPLQKSYAIGYRPLDGYTVPFSNDGGYKSTPLGAGNALDFTQYEIGRAHV